ncbi:glycosyltransferase family 2 protein [Chromatocurvus halotolerans]|uniref:Cellulose synthase/poly-beta-1,6-N-acetylglucosamine synthase-like glycosyltransferase n=1 Tax=Chromatocurvus halotolerans TaxID=1132028 RepID=A0A4R2KRI1_9GAMM|nr:glycosyltransferase [Chromatocurvus halotolerans]TCO76294.1 cellulose synthase/poly-beta-1,6-N-acetylglucosamine synthase-like glycosyltransferase [Chromatocurvus halotolerans]
MIEDAFTFFFNLEPRQLLFYFWPFFFFDFARYVLLDLLVLVVYLPGLRRRRRGWLWARKRLYKERPLVSILVPGKNEGRHLERLAHSLRRQSYSNFEVVVVDDGSDDDTPAIGGRLLRQGLIHQFIRNETRGGKASAANTALSFSRGTYIVHLDADTHLSPGALEEVLIPFYLDSRVGAVGADIRVANSDHSLTTRLQHIEYMKTLSTGRTVSSILGILRIVSGACGAFRRDMLIQLGGWDVGPGLDGDIIQKIRKLGFRIVHQPRAACYTHVPETFTSLARQRYRWDRSLIRFRVRKHANVLRPDRNFALLNFLSTAENLFANVALNLKWWVYLVQMILFAPQLMSKIFIINYFLYTVCNVIGYGVATVLYGRTMTHREWALIPFIPLMPLYTGIYLRIVRTYAYLMELCHRTSYRDRWNPWKVSAAALRDRL